MIDNGDARLEPADDVAGASCPVTEEKLRARLRAVGVSGSRQYNPGWHTTLDLQNLLTVSEAVTRAALERRESRGAHTRVEHPGSDDRFGEVNVIIRRRNGKMVVERERLPQVPSDMKEILEGNVKE